MDDNWIEDPLPFGEVWVYNQNVAGPTGHSDPKDHLYDVVGCLLLLLAHLEGKYPGLLDDVEASNLDRFGFPRDGD